MILFNPPKQLYSLAQNLVPFQIVCRNGVCRLIDLRSERTWEKDIRPYAPEVNVYDLLIVEPIHDEFLHALHRIVKLRIRHVPPHFAVAHPHRNELSS